MCIYVVWFICVLAKGEICPGRNLDARERTSVVQLNPFSAKDVLVDFTLSNAGRFYSSKGNPLALKGLITKETLFNFVLVKRIL